MSNFNSTIWLLDDHEIRRIAVAGFLSGWAERNQLRVCAISSANSVSAPNSDVQSAEMCILATGGTSLADPELADIVRSLVLRLAGRPLAIFSDLDSSVEVNAAIALGAHGLISTMMSGTFAIAAFDFILAGGTYFKQSALVSLLGRPSPPNVRHEMTGRLLSIPSFGPSAHDISKVTQMRTPAIMAPANTEVLALTDITGLPHLTLRQKDIVEMLKLGKSNKEIARLLDISDATVKIFVRQVMKKYGAINRTQVALMASEAMLPRDIRNGHLALAAGVRTN